VPTEPGGYARGCQSREERPRRVLALGGEANPDEDSPAQQRHRRGAGPREVGEHRLQDTDAPEPRTQECQRHRHEEGLREARAGHRLHPGLSTGKLTSIDYTPSYHYPNQSTSWAARGFSIRKI
jgi:hypothetical protein